MRRGWNAYGREWEDTIKGKGERQNFLHNGVDACVIYPIAFASSGSLPRDVVVGIFGPFLLIRLCPNGPVAEGDS